MAIKIKDYELAIEELKIEVIKDMASEIPKGFNLDAWEFMHKANKEYKRRTSKEGKFEGTVAEAIKREIERDLEIF